MSQLTRTVGVVVFSAVLAITAAACSDGDDTASTSGTVPIRPSSYVVRDPVTTTTAAPVDTAVTAEGIINVEQTYTVKSGDNPSQIAQLYEVDLDELRNYNGWASDYSDFPAVDGIVRIPPGAKFIDPAATTTTAAGEEGEEGEAATATTTGGSTAPDGDCAPGSYTIEDGDTPIGLAAEFDVTLEALTQANGWVPDYSNFPATGETITIPPGSDCTPTT